MSLSDRFKIIEEIEFGDQVVGLLHGHLDEMAAFSPPGCVHALDLEGLQTADVTFYTVWEGEVLVGCGALKELEGGDGEIKSMRTASEYLRQGIGRMMVEYLLQEARKRGYTRVSLETGNTEYFQAAHALYRGFGFEACEPFADYAENDFSQCMTLKLDAGEC